MLQIQSRELEETEDLKIKEKVIIEGTIHQSRFGK